MSNIKFYNDKYRQFKYNLRNFIVNKKRPNHSIKRENISLTWMYNERANITSEPLFHIVKLLSSINLL